MDVAKFRDWDDKLRAVPTVDAVRKTLASGGHAAVMERWGQIPSKLLRRAATDSRRRVPNRP